MTAEHTLLSPGEVDRRRALHASDFAMIVSRASYGATLP
jgi:hypothetical protein